MANNNAVNTTLTGQSGTGAFAGNISPAFTTPNLGAAVGSSLNLGSSTLVSSVINSSTFVGASGANLNTATATQTYIDARTVFGNWTPVITFDTPGTLAVTYATQIGRYLRVTNSAGLNFVFIWGSINCSAFTLGTATGQFRVSGLPFASTSSGIAGTICTSGALNFTWAGGTTLVGFPSGGSTFLLWRGISASSFTGVTQTSFSAALPNLNFNGLYVGN